MDWGLIALILLLAVIAIVDVASFVFSIWDMFFRREKPPIPDRWSAPCLYEPPIEED